MAEDHKQKRAVVRRKVTTVLKKLEQDGDGDQRPEGEQVRALLLEVDKLADQLETLNDNIALEQSEEEMMSDYEAFLNLKLRVTALKDHGEEHQQSATAARGAAMLDQQPPPHHVQPDVPLSKLQDIDSFNGDPLKWQTFWDSCYLYSRYVTI